MTILKYALHSETRLKRFNSLPFLIELSYKITTSYMESCCLMAGLKNCDMHFHTKHISFSHRPQISNLDSLKCMHFSFGYFCKSMHLNTLWCLINVPPVY